MDYKAQMLQPDSGFEEAYQLPSGETLRIGKERFRYVNEIITSSLFIFLSWSFLFFLLGVQKYYSIHQGWSTKGKRRDWHNWYLKVSSWFHKMRLPRNFLWRTRHLFSVWCLKKSWARYPNQYVFTSFFSVCSVLSLHLFVTSSLAFPILFLFFSPFPVVLCDFLSDSFS